MNTSKMLGNEGIGSGTMQCENPWIFCNNPDILGRETTTDRRTNLTFFVSVCEVKRFACLQNTVIGD